MIFAAGFNRTDAVKLLLARGADHKVTTKVVDLFALTAPEEEAMQRGTGGNSTRPATNRPADVAGATRAYRYNELISTQGGLSALLFAARQGYTDTAMALLDGGADINQPNAGDKTTPLLMAIINGHFDLATKLIDRGASVNTAAFNGVAPLFAVLNLQWAPKSLYPSPKAYQQQKTTYLELMQTLLAKGADPNARVARKVWYQAYNSDYAGFDEAGATPFFRAAYASDVAAMKLLVANGADPYIGTFKPAGRPFTGEGTRQIQDTSGLPAVPYGGPASCRFMPRPASATAKASPQIHIATRRPDSCRRSVPRRRDRRGCECRRSRRQHALHLCASRGDNACINYLVSKGADVTRVNREGNTTVDMANGPVQRTQPYPETIKLLEGLGAKNNHRCITC